MHVPTANAIVFPQPVGATTNMLWYGSWVINGIDTPCMDDGVAIRRLSTRLCCRSSGMIGTSESSRVSDQCLDFEMNGDAVFLVCFVSSSSTSSFLSSASAACLASSCAGSVF